MIKALAHNTMVVIVTVGMCAGTFATSSALAHMLIGSEPYWPSIVLLITIASLFSTAAFGLLVEIKEGRAFISSKK